MSDSAERYWLRDKGPWREVTQKKWVVAERIAGFRPKGEDRGQPATGGFGNGNSEGAITYGDKKPHGWEPDPIAAAYERGKAAGWHECGAALGDAGVDTSVILRVMSEHERTLQEHRG